jgi:hypothetical protein
MTGQARHRLERMAWAGVLVVTAASAAASCGYSLAGRGSFLPTYIRRIGIPVFANGTQVFDIEQILTQRVRVEFMGRGKYEIVPQGTGVDAVLTGTISSLSVVPSGFNQQQQASRYAATLTVAIEFRDLKTDRVLWSNPSLTFREEYEVSTVTSAVDPTLFFDQNANALERLAVDFARTVVSAVVEAF